MTIHWKAVEHCVLNWGAVSFCNFTQFVILENLLILDLVPMLLSFFATCANKNSWG